MFRVGRRPIRLIGLWAFRTPMPKKASSMRHFSIITEKGYAVHEQHTLFLIPNNPLLRLLKAQLRQMPDGVVIL